MYISNLEINQIDYTSIIHVYNPYQNHTKGSKRGE